MPKKKKKYYYKKVKAGVKFDTEGYALFPDYKPMPYELVEFHDESNKKNNGWWTGHRWDCLYPRTNGNIIKWKYIPYEQEGGWGR